MGVIRRYKTVSGLIKYQPKGDPADWAAAAKGILASENPDAIVVILGLDDRIAIREPATEKSDSTSSDKKTDKKDAKAKPDAKPAVGKPSAKPSGGANATAKLDDKPVDTELSPDDATDNDAPPAIAPAKSTRSPNGIYEFREERWVELYTKKIEEMIGVLKSRVCRCCGSVCQWCVAPRLPPTRCSWISALSRCSRQGRHHLCRCLGRICRRSRALPAEGSRLRRPDPAVALL